MVTTSAPAARRTGVTHERTTWPLRWTVHAPHRASPQPYFVPVRPSTSRRAHSNGISGSTSSCCGVPFTRIVILTAAPPRPDIRPQSPPTPPRSLRVAPAYRALVLGRAPETSPTRRAPCRGRCARRSPPATSRRSVSDLSAVRRSGGASCRPTPFLWARDASQVLPALAPAPGCDPDDNRRTPFRRRRGCQAPVRPAADGKSFLFPEQAHHRLDG